MLLDPKASRTGSESFAYKADIFAILQLDFDSK